MTFPFFPFTEHVSEFLHWQKRWSGATFLAGEACDRLNATHRYEGKDYYMGCIWFSWPALSGFRITKHSSEWKDGISLLRRTSFLSGAPWCTEPPLGSLPRATALCSMPATSRRGNTTPHTYQWLPTQVSQTYNVCVSPTQQYCFSFFFFSSFCCAIKPAVHLSARIQDGVGHVYGVVPSWLFLHKRE